MRHYFIVACCLISALSFGQKEEKVSSGKAEGGGGIEITCPLGQTKYYEDNDGDGYGNIEVSICSANPIFGYVTNGLDCNDANANIYQAAFYYIDNDGDGYGALGTFTCNPPANAVTVGGDCNDNDPNIINNPTVWYQDQDNDGFGDPNSTTTSCLVPSGYVDNSLDACPSEYGVDNGCPVGGPQENMNWIISKSYDNNEGLMSSSKAYYNGLGNNIQIQSIDVKTGKIWASETKYDSQGRPAFQTLGAPVRDNSFFLYEPNFTKKPNGTDYNTNDFEVTPEAPAQVGAQVNSLGWYYSENNTSEPYQDVTDYPFSRTIYSELNPGSALKAIGGNKVNVDGQEQWLSGFSYTMLAAQEMLYVFGLNYYSNGLEDEEVCSTYLGEPISSSGALRRYNIKLVDDNCTPYGGNEVVNMSSEQPLSVNSIYRINYDGVAGNYMITYMNPTPTNNPDDPAWVVSGPINCSVETCESVKRIAHHMVYKTVAKDVHGVETVAFTDEDGKLLASARSGGAVKYDVISLIGAQKYVDIHIPEGISNGEIELLGNSSYYKIYDLRTELIVAPSQMQGGNFYRVEYLGDVPIVNSHIDVYGAVSAGNQAVGVKYKVNYYDYALNYYDKAGRLLKSTQPLGFDSSCLSMITETPMHTMETTYVYNASGELLETQSPDEGQAQFIYREDGKIRFSQNSKQSIVDEFSYTNYDEKARPVESGVYKGPASFGLYSLKPLNIVNAVRIKQEGNQLTKLAAEGWNSGAATTKKINGNGYIKWQFSSDDVRAMVGLSPSNANHTFSTIAYAIYAIDGEIRAYKNGQSMGSFGSYVQTDEFKLEKQGTTIYYKKNDVTFYTTTTTTQSLLGDFAFDSVNAGVIDFEMGGDIITQNIGVFKNTRRVSVVGNTITKNSGSNTAWNASGASSQTIIGDGYVQFKASQPDKELMAGLSNRVGYQWGGYGSINHAISFQTNGTFGIYELGNNKGNFGNYTTNDLFKVERVGNSITYYKNGQEIYTSTMPSYSNEDLEGRINIRNLNGGLHSFEVAPGHDKFIDFYNALPANNSLKKVSDYAWNAGFASAETINGDGFVQFETPSNTVHLMLGLSSDNPNVSYNAIDFALFINRNQRVYVFESGAWKGERATYEPGDVFKVERTGTNGTVRYYKNNEVIYTSGNTSTAPLLIDASFHDPESYVQNLQFYDMLDESTEISANTVLDPQYCTERTITVYDKPLTDYYGFLDDAGINYEHYHRQNFVAGNVSKTYTDMPATSETWYSYDVYGRVEWMIQNIKGLGAKTIDYEYDPVLGVITKVIYQKHQEEELFVHLYEYNQIGQLMSVSTSKNNTDFEIEAKYYYSETGALERAEVAGGNQGIDYIYNLGGQLKAINHPSLSSTTDPGGDANDVFGMHIDYFKGDYSRNNTPKPIITSAQGANRYDGNIKAIRWATKDLNEPGEHSAFTYEYNDSKWLTQAVYGTANASGTITDDPNGDYKVDNLSYDANGNLLTLNRNRHTVGSENAMDAFDYNYNGLTNQLSHVDDAITIPGESEDLQDQEPSNYTYNAIGQLVEDSSTKLKYVYNASGLVTQILKDEQPFLNIYYNDRGHRVRKEVTYDEGGTWYETYYARDASGQVMAIYNGSYGDSNSAPKPNEYPIYGANRLGIYNRASNKKIYQIADHLGNVRALVNQNGEKLGHTDYYPFGMAMPKRNLDNDYRYGFQGEFAEKETELGQGINSFQLRLYDSRIGRWISPDPYGEFFSPYMAMANNPISVTDPDGGCTTAGGRNCEFSVVTGQATDGGGNIWTKDFGTGDIELLNLQRLDLVFISNKKFDFWDGVSDGIKKWGGNSGSTMYGNGSGNLSRKGDGDIYGVWYHDEILYPGGSGPTITRWTSTPKFNMLVDVTEAFNGGLSAGNHVDNVIIERVIKPVLIYVKSEKVVTYQYTIHLNLKKVDSNKVEVNLNGTKIENTKLRDSIKNARNSQRERALNWFNN